jgi:hypothetical protein
VEEAEEAQTRRLLRIREEWVCAEADEQEEPVLPRGEERNRSRNTEG